MRLFFLALLLGPALAAPAFGQSADEGTVTEIQDAYRQFDYDEAERMAREALRRYSDFTVEQLTEIHTVLGLVAYNRGDLSEARRQFTSALQLMPGFSLDPLLISPKIVEFFDEIKADLAVGDSAEEDAPVRYVLMRDRRTDAALRSMLLPGWGQFYKGHTTKGWIASSLFGAAAAGAAGAHIKRNAAERDYEGETDPDLVQERYDTLNRWHKTRNGLLQVAAAVWVVSYVDALLTRESIGRDPSRVALNASPSSISLAVRF